MVHYVNAMGFKKSGWTAFTASIFDLGVKGLVKIDKVGKTTSITATSLSMQKLPAGEQGIYSISSAPAARSPSTRPTGRNSTKNAPS